MNLALLEKIDLSKGAHRSRVNGVCMMEAVAWVAGLEHTDHPQCVCPIIGAFLRSWNDGLPSNADRNRLLKPLIAVVIGTKSTKEVEDKRAFMALDWFVRTWLSQWLEDMNAKRYACHIAALRSAPEMGSCESLADAMPVLIATKKEAAAAAWDAARAAARAAARDAAWDAARAAAWAAARDAAWDAARAAARDAARAAAWAAAWDAAWDAAWAAAWDAARGKLQSSVAKLQESATELIKRMCEAT